MAEKDNGQRLVLSEYHGAGSISGVFMIRDGIYKYIFNLIITFTKITILQKYIRNQNKQ